MPQWVCYLEIRVFFLFFLFTLENVNTGTFLTSRVRKHEIRKYNFMSLVRGNLILRIKENKFLECLKVINVF